MINIIKDHYKNISIITIATITGLISGALCQILRAKLLSVEKFGLYSTAMGFVNVLIPLSTIGIPVFLLKKYGEVKKEISPWSNKGLKTILISSTLFVLFLTTLSTQTSQNDDYIKLIFSVSFLIIFNSIIEFQKYLFQINNKFQTFSWLKVSPFLLRVIFLVIIFLLGTKISPIIIGLVFSAIALVVSIFFFLTFERKKLKHFNYKKVFSKHNLGTKTLLLETLPFALNAVLYLTWSQGYVILTKFKFNDYNAGIFAIVVFIMTTVNLIPSTIFSKYITPKIHLAFYNNSTKIRDLFVKWNSVMFCFGIAVGLILYLLSPLFVSVFFERKILRSNTTCTIIYNSNSP